MTTEQKVLIAKFAADAFLRTKNDFHYSETQALIDAGINGFNLYQSELKDELFAKLKVECDYIGEEELKGRTMLGIIKRVFYPEDVAPDFIPPTIFHKY